MARTDALRGACRAGLDMAQMTWTGHWEDTGKPLDLVKIRAAAAARAFGAGGMTAARKPFPSRSETQQKCVTVNESGH